jgi:hypothetical protein
VVFGAVSTLLEGGTPVDLVAVAEHLWKTGKIWQAGGFVRLAELWDWACAPAEVSTLAEVLIQTDPRAPDPPTQAPQILQWLQSSDKCAIEPVQALDMSFDFGANVQEGSSGFIGESNGDSTRSQDGQEQE